MTVMKIIYTSGTNSIKDLCINYLTKTLRGLIQYTDRYDKANQLHTVHRDKIKTIVSQFGFSYSTAYNIRERTT